MTQEEAEQLSIALLQIVGKLDDSASFVRDNDSEDNWDKYRRAVGQAMATVALELSEPLWARYPELKPEYLGGPYLVDPKIYEPRFYGPV